VCVHMHWRGGSSCAQTQDVVHAGLGLGGVSGRVREVGVQVDRNVRHGEIELKGVWPRCL
jgi:hypothetical protein